MIAITNKADCCGCTACKNICPKDAIEMLEDSEGFLYPKINQEKCVNCGLCKKTCPVNSEPIPREPIKVLAAQNRNIKYRIKTVDLKVRIWYVRRKTAVLRIITKIIKGDL